MATLCLLKLKIFWNKGYDVIIYVYDFTNQTLSRDSNCIVDVIIWLKFGKSSIYMREVIITSMLQRFGQKNHYFWGVFLVEVQ